MAIKVISELEAQKQQATSEFEQLSQQANSLFSAGDQLGAAKLTQQAQKYVDFVGKADRMILDQKENLTTKLANGSFLSDKDPMDEPLTTSEGVDNKIAKGISAVIGQPVNMQSELGWKERSKLAFLNDVSKDEYLKSQYGEENIKTMNVMGKPVRLINDGTSWFPVDRYDLTSNDFIDMIGEIAPMIGSLVGGSGGAVLSKSPAGTAIGSAAGYTAAGTLQDTLAKAVMGAGEGFGESITKRATEAMIGLPIEYGIAKIGEPILRGLATMRKGTTPKRTQLISEAGEFLNREGYPTSLARFAGGSVEQQQRMLRAAENLPNSKIGQDLAFGAKRLEAFMDDNISRQALPERLYEDTMKAVKAENDLYLKQVAISDEGVANTLRKNLDDDLQKRLIRPEIQEEAAATYLKATLGKAKSSAEKAKKDIYNPFYQEADQIVSVDPLELARKMEDQYFKQGVRPVEIDNFINELRARPQNAKIIADLQSKINSGSLTPQIKELSEREIRRLENISGPLNASQLDEQFRKIRDLAPTGPIAGSGATQLKTQVKNAEGVLQQFRDDVYKKAKLYDKWTAATEKNKNFLQYTKTNISDILEIGIGKEMTSRKVMDTVYSSPEQTRLILSAVKRDDPANYAVFAESMRESYMNRIGLNGRGLGSGVGFKFDDRIVRELFGSENLERGNRMVQKLEGLQSVFKFKKLDPSKISMKDVQELEGVLHQDGVRDITASIANRAEASQKAEKLGRNILIKDVLNGHKESITRGEFPRALFDAEPAQVRKIFSMFKPAEQKAIREDFAEHVFSRYPGNPDSTIMRLKLWDGETFLNDIAANPKLQENMKIALGEPFVNKMVAASRLTEATQTVAGGAKMRLTGVVTPEETRGFLALGPVLNSIGTRATAAMYRAGSLVPLLGKMSQKELTKDQFERESVKALGVALLTSNGIQATLKTGRYDPEWSRRIGQTLGTASKESVDYAKAFGYGTRF